ncbi:hypothetical protein CRI70_04160 [Streptomyces sp. Ru87]|nr:hypothetical protein CRI70_04160 [Streptomyces sp. Ru87]
MSPFMGGAVLLIFLDGLRADMSGTLSDWYSALSHRLPQTLGAPSAGGQQAPRANQPSGWQVMADLQNSAQEVLTSLVGYSHGGNSGPGALNVRLALIEDVLAGVLRRMAIPADMATWSAGELAVATGSLFGGSTRPAPPFPSQESHAEHH